jgi:acetate---CoA ligase (ADP-forming)
MPLKNDQVGSLLMPMLHRVRFTLPATADKVQITEALGKLRAAKLLVGMRGAPPADLTAAAEVVLAISGLMQSIPEISEIDINPLMCTAKARARRRSTL